MADLARSAAKAYDQLLGLQPAGERVAGVARLVGQLTAEDFDLQTIVKASTAVEAMFATVAATESAYLSAGNLEQVMGRF